MRSSLLCAALALLVSTAVAAEPSYPVINETDFLEHVQERALKLLADGKTKGSADLTPELEDRPPLHLTLTPAASEPIGDRELYQRACRSVFVVAGLLKSPDQPEKWDFATATAFALAPDGVLATCRHVFAARDPVEAFLAVDPAGEVFPIEEILAADKDSDICLFRIAATGLTPLPLGESPPPGERIRVVSHPGYFFYYFAAGHVANYFTDDDRVTWQNVTADFGQGASGAPVFDERGNVVGQVSRTLTLYASGTVTEDDLVRGRRVRATHRRSFAERLRPTALQKKSASKDDDESDDEPTATPTAEGSADEMDELQRPAEEVGDPQMVFKICVPAESLRKLVQ